jgi:uncharacterized repeat protein (TIGR03803 family)
MRKVHIVALVLLVGLAGCGGGGSSQSPSPPFLDNQQALDQALNNANAVAQQAAPAIGSSIDAAQRAQTLVDASAIAASVGSMPHVRSAAVTSSGAGVVIQQDDGLFYSLLLSNLADSRLYQEQSGSGSLLANEEALSNRVSHASTTSGASALILTPFSSQVGNEDSIAATLQSAGFNVTILKDANADVAHFRGDFLQQFDVVFIETHAGRDIPTIDGTLSTVLATGEPVVGSTSSPSAFQGLDHDQRRSLAVVAPEGASSNHWGISVSWLELTGGRDFGNALIFVNGCETAYYKQGPESLSAKLFSLGAGGFVGYDDLIYIPLARAMANKSLSLMSGGGSLRDASNATRANPGTTGATSWVVRLKGVLRTVSPALFDDSQRVPTSPFYIISTEPTLSLIANPTSITAGQSSTLTWSSTNASSCTASAGWSGSKPVSGSTTVAPTATTTYTLTCTGPGGTTSANATVTVSAVTKPTVSISANPTSITAGQSSTLTWSSTNASSCTASGGWSGNRGTSGMATVSPTATATYTLTCTGTGGSTSNSVTITVNAQPQVPNVSVLHDFGASDTDCKEPTSPVILDTSGNLYGTTVSGGSNQGGCVYGVNQGGAYIAAFVRGSISGGSPYAGLSRGQDGTYYGTTSAGGLYGCGDVYKITVDGTASTLYDFGSSQGDGCGPKAGVVQGSDGYLYGTTTSGGQNGTGTVFKMTTSGAEVWVYSFPGPRNFGDFATPLGDLIEATDGNLYGTASGSGDYQQGFVFRVSHSGVVTILYSFGAFADDGANPEAGVIQGRDGYLYGTTKSGGARLGGGTVFRITLSGAESVLHSFGSFGAGTDGDGSSPVAPLVQGIDGNFYGTTSEGGAGGGTSGLAPPTGTIFRITPSGDETVLWSFFGDDFRGSPPVDPQTPMAGLIQAQDGSFYGTSNAGGRYGGGTVFRLTFSTP